MRSQGTKFLSVVILLCWLTNRPTSLVGSAATCLFSWSVWSIGSCAGSLAALLQSLVGSLIGLLAGHLAGGLPNMETSR